jgi:molecular chaperone HscB
MSNYFQFYGLATRYHLDTSDLRKRYLQRSRADHPDFHAQSQADDQAQALDLTAYNNLAYQTLLDPYLRLAYILQLEGLISPSGENNSTIELSIEFLMDIMEMNELMEEGPTDEQIQQLQAQLEQQVKENWQKIEQLMSDYDQAYTDSSTASSTVIATSVMEYYLRHKYFLRMNQQIHNIAPHLA